MSGNDLSIIVRNNAPEDFDRAVQTTEFPWDSERSAWNDFFCARYHPLSGLYEPYVAFIVAWGGSPIALVECNREPFSIMQYGDPITIRTAAGVKDDLEVLAQEVALFYIDRIAQQFKSKMFFVADLDLGAEHEIPEGIPLSPVGRFCSSRPHVEWIETVGKVDLSLGESGIHRHLRRSYRSLVNWGRKNMHMLYYNADNPDRTLLKEFLTMRKRSDVHGDYCEPVLAFFRDTIESGRGELSLGLVEGEAVAGTLTFWAGKTTHYLAGIYPDRGKNRPLTHWPVYDSILRSRDRGDRCFSMGRLHLHDSFAVSEYRRGKMASIAFFKKGFCTKFENRSYWEVQVG